MNLTRRLFFTRSAAASAAVAIAPAAPAPLSARRDDGPLLSDDVTGTNAYELYASGDQNWRENARPHRETKS